MLTHLVPSIPVIVSVACAFHFSIFTLISFANCACDRWQGPRLLRWKISSTSPLWSGQAVTKLTASSLSQGDRPGRGIMEKNRRKEKIEKTRVRVDRAHIPTINTLRLKTRCHCAQWKKPHQNWPRNGWAIRHFTYLLFRREKVSRDAIVT